ncbi:tyrosine-type DNA invertase [Leminorella grimontii]|uniref:tyrosine-type DNA invertase n=1 Tax=Leminorella grimontii TaxID=82981 RepID=UPI002084C5DE|nr:tyrosine-type DNA invertase [Leminorella grimontii]GKX58661.1 DNA recombinase [Leminorella grimontii]
MPKRKYLSGPEVEALLEATRFSRHKERNHCLIYMAYIHGLRASELLDLRISDLDLRYGTLNVRRLKNGFSTIHPLLAREIKAIKAWINVRRSTMSVESDWLFTTAKGTPLSRQQFYNIIRESGERAGCSFCPHPHMLRHACGFALADRGIDTRLIQDYLGHRNIRHTVRYTASNAARFKGIWRVKNSPKKGQLGPNCQAPNAI